MSYTTLAPAVQIQTKAGDAQKELAFLNSQLAGKYTWLHIEDKSLFFKITNTVELRKLSEIRKGEFHNEETHRCGSIAFQDGSIPVFDFRPREANSPVESNSSGKILVLKLNYHDNLLVVGFLCNHPDEIVF